MCIGVLNSFLKTPTLIEPIGALNTVNKVHPYLTLGSILCTQQTRTLLYVHKTEGLHFPQIESHSVHCALTLVHVADSTLDFSLVLWQNILTYIERFCLPISERTYYDVDEQVTVSEYSCVVQTGVRPQLDARHDLLRSIYLFDLLGSVRYNL